MEFGVEYLRSTSNKCYYGSVKKSKCSFSCHLQIGWFFSWRPIKVLLVCAFSPSVRMINLKKPYLIAPPGPTNYDKATYIVSSNLCLFAYPQVTGFPWNSYPHRHISAKRVFLKFIPVFLMLTFQIINTPVVSQYKENWTLHSFWDFLTNKTFRRKTYIIL